MHRVLPSQGGLPTFLDVGKSFSASTVTEDNIISQLLMQQKRLVGAGLAVAEVHEQTLHCMTIAIHVQPQCPATIVTRLGCVAQFQHLCQ